MSEYIITQGVDLHKRYFVYNSLDRRDGEEKVGKVYLNDREGMERYFSQFDVPSEVAVEASGSWYWFVDMLQKNGVKVHPSNPKQTKAIAWAKVKNDRVDARMLRKLLESNLLPEGGCQDFCVWLVSFPNLKLNNCISIAQDTRIQIVI